MPKRRYRSFKKLPDPGPVVGPAPPGGRMPPGGQAPPSMPGGFDPVSAYWWYLQQSYKMGVPDQLRVGPSWGQIGDLLYGRGPRTRPKRPPGNTTPYHPTDPVGPYLPPEYEKPFIPPNPPKRRRPRSPTRPPKREPKRDPYDDPDDPDEPDDGPNQKFISKMGGRYASGKRHRRGKRTHSRRFSSANALYKAMFPQVFGQFQVAGQILGVANEKYVVQCATSFAPPSRLLMYTQQIENATTAAIPITTNHFFNYIKGKFHITNAGDVPIHLKMWELHYKQSEDLTFQNMLGNLGTNADWNPVDGAIAVGQDYKLDQTVRDYTDGTPNTHTGVRMGILYPWQRIPGLMKLISLKKIFSGRMEANDELDVKVSSKELKINQTQLLYNDSGISAVIGIPTKYFLFELQGYQTHAVTDSDKVGLTAAAIDYIYTETFSGTKRPAYTDRVYANTATQVFPMNDAGIVETELTGQTAEPVD